MNRDCSEGRLVRLGTVYGTIDGYFRVSPQVRTLDYLNMNAERFVTVEVVESTCDLVAPVVSVNCWSIRWLAELEGSRAGPRAHRVVMNRVGVRFGFGDGEVRGFLHAPAGGEPSSRWNQPKSQFVAVTSASISDPDREFAAGFVAVNSRMLFTAELLDSPENREEAAQPECSADFAS